MCNSVRHAGTRMATGSASVCEHFFFNQFIHDTDNETHNNLGLACNTQMRRAYSGFSTKSSALPVGASGSIEKKIM